MCIVQKCMPDLNERMIALQDHGIVDGKDDKQQMKYPVLGKFALKTIKVWLEECFPNLSQNISRCAHQLMKLKGMKRHTFCILRPTRPCKIQKPGWDFFCIYQ